MKRSRFISVFGLWRLASVILVGAAFLGSAWVFGVSPVRAELFSVTMECPNVITYSFTNDTNETYQYYVTVTDSDGNGLGSTPYSVFLKPGESLPKDGETLSLALVRVPSEGDLTATLWRVPAGDSATSVTSVTLTNCWPPELSTPGSVTTGTASLGTPSTSRIHFTCSATGIALSLTDAQNRVLSTPIAFDNQALLKVGSEGIYRSVGNYGVLSVAGSQGWDGMYYYAAWNGGIYDANGRGDFSLTFKCTQ